MFYFNFLIKNINRLKAIEQRRLKATLRMTYIDQLATSLGRRDEAPNQALARLIAVGNIKSAISELVAVINGKDKALQSDAIKVLYEEGGQNPALIAEHVDLFVALLSGKNNRLAWGAMTALNEIAAITPSEVFAHLPTILKAADEGSVITRDGAVGILVKLSSMDKHRDTCFPLLLEQMQKCPPNQFPMYSENAAGMLTPEMKPQFVALLKERLPDLPKESQQKRIEKVLKKLSK